MVQVKTPTLIRRFNSGVILNKNELDQIITARGITANNTSIERKNAALTGSSINIKNDKSINAKPKT